MCKCNGQIDMSWQELRGQLLCQYIVLFCEKRERERERERERDRERLNPVYHCTLNSPHLIILWNISSQTIHDQLKMLYMYSDIPVNLSDPHGRRSPAIENEKAGSLARQLFWA